MLTRVKVQGFNEFLKAVKECSDKPVYIFFSGAKKQDGKSWCPDCVVAEPVVEKCLNDLTHDATYVYCEVGERNYWKDKGNEFRSYEQLRLTGVPTLMKWGSPRKLVEDECAKADLVAMFFEED